MVLSRGQKPLFHRVSISSEVNSSRCAGLRSLGEVCLWMAHISLFLTCLCFLFSSFHSYFPFWLPFFLSSSHTFFLSLLLCLHHCAVTPLSRSSLLFFFYSYPLLSFLPSRSRCSTLISHKAEAYADENNKIPQQEQGQRNHLSTQPDIGHNKSHTTVKLSKHPN